MKLFYPVKMFSEETGEEHQMTVGSIQDSLFSNHQVSTDRNIFYTVFQALRDFCVGVSQIKNTANIYSNLINDIYQLTEKRTGDYFLCEIILPFAVKNIDLEVINIKKINN